MPNHITMLQSLTISPLTSESDDEQVFGLNCPFYMWTMEMMAFFFPCSSSNAHSIFFEGFMSTRIVVLVRCVKRTCWMGGEMVLKANEDAQLQRAS